MKKQITILCLILLYSGVGFSADELKSVAKVLSLSGRATATPPNNKKRKLKENSPLYIGDKINTGRWSKIEIKFKDNSQIDLGPKACLTIDKFLFEKDNKSSHSESSITTGTFRIIGGAISKVAPDNMKVKTASATIGIRGTIGIGKCNAKQTTAIFVEGKAISTSNSQGTVILSKKYGHGCVTEKGKAPGRPRIFTPREINAIFRGININRNSDATGRPIKAGRRHSKQSRRGTKTIHPAPVVPPKHHPVTRPHTHYH
jgi:hypothetical protein